jgi:glycerol uptake facilitator-like aquaporin
MGVEALGTAVLVFVIFALVDHRNEARPLWLTPFFIGFTVAVLISIFAPITQAGWNPARDFGPRIVAFLAGWGDVAIPGPRNGFWIYIVGPLLGGPIGAALYDLVLRPAHRDTEDFPAAVALAGLQAEVADPVEVDGTR